ncbi:MAG: large subunit ribosomal protein L25, partial [Candidatus Krumholzibacteriia bacterium]
VALSLDSIEISCRPSELPEVIEVDITDMELNDKIFVKDVVFPVGEVITDPEMLVLNIKPASILVEPEVVEEEGVEGAEGDEAAAEGEEGSDAGDKSGD